MVRTACVWWEPILALLGQVLGSAGPCLGSVSVRNDSEYTVSSPHPSTEIGSDRRILRHASAGMLKLNPAPNKQNRRVVWQNPTDPAPTLPAWPLGRGARDANHSP